MHVGLPPFATSPIAVRLLLVYEATITRRGCKGLHHGHIDMGARPATEGRDMPTMIEVAALAGVSTATVSRVLSRPERVSEETRRHVLAIVRSSGYVPNVAARSLRTLRAAKILLTVPDISNTFFA